jgi:hypothetical protein
MSKKDNYTSIKKYMGTDFAEAPVTVLFFIMIPFTLSFYYCAVVPGYCSPVKRLLF